MRIVVRMKASTECSSLEAVYAADVRSNLIELFKCERPLRRKPPGGGGAGADKDSHTAETTLYP